MNKNLRVITINGIRGLLMIIFIILGLIAGFIISPAWVCMKLWNTFVINYLPLTPMSIYQGILLWGVIALSLYAINNKRALVGFGSYSKLTPEQIKDIMNKAKTDETAFFKDFEILKTPETMKNNDIKNEQNESESQEEIRG